MRRWCKFVKINSGVWCIPALRAGTKNLSMWCASSGVQNVSYWLIACEKYLFSFSPSVPQVAQRKLQFYDAPVILNDVACSGSETNITQCTRAGYSNITDCIYIAVAQCEGMR